MRRSTGYLSGGIFAILMAVSTLGCGGSATGTFVLLELKAGEGTAPAEGLASVELEIDLAGKKAMSTLRARVMEGTIQLPTTASLEVGQGQGALTVVARALDGAGVEQGRGRGMGKVERGRTTRLTVSIDFGVGATTDGGQPTDSGGGGALGGADAGGSPRDSATGDMSIAQDAGGGAGAGDARTDPASDGSVSAGDARTDATADAVGVAGPDMGSRDGAADAGAPDVPVVLVDASADTSAQGMPDLPPGSMGTDAGAGDAGPDSLEDALEPADGDLDAGPDMQVIDTAPDLMPDVALPPMLGVDKATHDFGNVVVNANSSATTLTVSNAGGLATGSLSVAFVSTPDAQFALVSDACSGVALAPGGTCLLSYRFTPNMTGMASATVTVTAMPGGMVTTTLSGTAITQGAVSIEPNLSDFGNVVLGNLTERMFSVKNVGGAPTGNVGLAFGGTDAAQFSIVSDGCTGMPIVGGGSCMVTVRFAPNSKGFKSASLTAVAAPGGTGVATVTGTALAPALLALSPTSYDFGQVNTGTMSAPVVFTVRNDGEEPSGVPTASLTGADAGQYSISGNTCSAAIPPAGTCTVSVLFAPSTYNLKNAILTVTASPGATAIAPLRGTGRDYLPLTVNKMGTGFGTVTSSEAIPLINCGVTCMANFPRTSGNPTVTLTATPAVSSTFTSWQGCDSVSGPTCTITLAAAATVVPTFTIRTFTLTVSKIEQAGAAGGVTSQGATSPAIDCGATCSGVYNYGTTVTLAATPTMHYFGGWSGACSGFAACVVTMTADRAVAARFNPANKMFVTPMPMSIASLKALGSGTSAAELMLSGADKHCNNLAAAASLPGTFVAYLSSNTVSAGTRLGAARGWLRVDGRAFVDSIQAPFLPNQTFSPPMLDHLGNTVNVSSVLTASTTTGALYSSSYTCNNWADTSSASSARTGLSSAAAPLWASQNVLACSGDFHLFCFETTNAARVSPPPIPATGRKVIFTSRSAGPTGGLANADAVCALDATAVGLPGTFRAMLATTTAAIPSRFTVTGVPVYRPDGVLVATSDALLLNASPAILAPLNFVFNASAPTISYTSAYAWTGATSMASPTPALSPYSCMDWTSNLSSTLGYVGYTAYSLLPPSLSQVWLYTTYSSCNTTPPTAPRFYCLQD